MERKNLWTVYSEEQLAHLESLNESYKKYLDAGKTERECVREAVKLAEAAGYKNLDEVIAAGDAVKAGDKLYAVCMEKTLALFCIGTEPVEKGMNILGAHVDSPRIDLKQNPLYENTEFAYLDTHYYGGIKKYQWVTLPLALHGVVVKKDGTIEDFYIEKIVVAVNKSATRVLVNLTEENLIEICNFVIENINAMSVDSITMLEMHSLVECALQQIDPQVALSYRNYRNYKQDFVGMLDKVFQEFQRII